MRILNLTTLAATYGFKNRPVLTDLHLQASETFIALATGVFQMQNLCQRSTNFSSREIVKRVRRLKINFSPLFM